MSVPGEGGWPRGPDAAGQQAGSGRGSPQRSENQGRAETRRCEAHLNIQTTFHSDLLTVEQHNIFFEVNEMKWFFFFTFLFIQQHQASFYECSAKTGRNVEELMTFLAG